MTTLTVDGQNRDLVNLWRNTNISAGDQLIFRLAFLPTKNFCLNHYYKGTVHQSFNNREYCWQLVPDCFQITHNPKRDLTQRYVYINQEMTQKKNYFEYDYRVDGYWRIGQSFQHRLATDEDVENFSNDLVFLRGQLLQITFAPVFVQYKCPAQCAKKKQSKKVKFNATSSSSADTFDAKRPNRQRVNPTSFFETKAASDATVNTDATPKMFFANKTASSDSSKSPANFFGSAFDAPVMTMDAPVSKPLPSKPSFFPSSIPANVPPPINASVPAAAVHAVKASAPEPAQVPRDVQMSDAMPTLTMQAPKPVMEGKDKMAKKIRAKVVKDT